MTDHYVRFAHAEGLPVLTHAEFTSLSGGPGDFTLGLRRTLPTLEPGQAGAVAEGAAPLQVRARRVVLATGRYVRSPPPTHPDPWPALSSSAALRAQDEPTLTGAGGETDARVSHYLAEWEEIEGQRLLFVGGGFSSADGVARLCGRNKCAWVTRKPQAQIDAMLYDQRTKWGMFEANVVNTEFFCESEVTDLTDGVAVIRPSGEGSEGGAEQSWRFDRCFMLTGHGPSSPLVDSVLSGDCAHDAESWESTTRPGCAK